MLLIILLTACDTKVKTSTSAAKGEIPCADCPGILYTLQLKNDNSYTEKLVYKGKSVDPFTSNGTWIINEDGKIVLNDSTKGRSPQYLLYNGKWVEMLDGDGNKIETNLNYKLLKKEAQTCSNISPGNGQNEIEFKATGNEPFWLVEIYFDKNI